MNKANTLMQLLEGNTRKELEKIYKTKDGVITSPGKFEGQLLYVPYFWEIFLDGGVDDEKGDVLIFKIDANDRKLFPEISKKQKTIKLKETGGFVSEV